MFSSNHCNIHFEYSWGWTCRKTLGIPAVKQHGSEQDPNHTLCTMTQSPFKGIEPPSRTSTCIQDGLHNFRRKSSPQKEPCSKAKPKVSTFLATISWAWESRSSLIWISQWGSSRRDRRCENQRWVGQSRAFNKRCTLSSSTLIKTAGNSFISGKAYRWAIAHTS